MIVYYDIIADKELASDSYESSNPAPGVRAIQSKKITISDDVGIASNADDEGDEGATAEALDDAAQTVINVVYSAKLTQINLDKKESVHTPRTVHLLFHTPIHSPHLYPLSVYVCRYKTLQKAYWKKLIDSLNELKWAALGFDTDNAPPTEKGAAAKAEEEAAKKLSNYDRKGYDDLVAKVKSYKTNFESLQKFVADEIIPNFDECEFYTCEDGELGSCMIVPARYVGEAPAPVFYLYVDGLREKKE